MKGGKVARSYVSSSSVRPHGLGTLGPEAADIEIEDGGGVMHHAVDGGGSRHRLPKMRFHLVVLRG